MKYWVVVLSLVAIVTALLVHPSAQDERLNRVRRADGDDDDEPSQADIDAARAALANRPKVARPAYSAGPDDKANQTQTQAGKATKPANKQQAAAPSQPIKKN